MCCSFSQSLPLLLLLFSLPSISCVSTIQNAGKQPTNKHLQPSNMDPSELETLFKMMDIVSSEHTSWSSSYPNPCIPGSSWVGIECKTGTDNHLHVTRLVFGTPPNPTCKNTSTFPSEIFSLPYLQSVFFFNCFVYTKTSIALFSQNRMFFNSSLQQLSLRSNPGLVGPIPSQISSLKSLQILTLSQNRLSGILPSELFSLGSLVHLDLSYNLLTGNIPNQLGSLRNLEGLDLSYNSLTGSIPYTVGQLGLLQKLDLSSNLLIGSIPNSIEKLNLLVFMALSNNRLRGEFPKGIAKLQNLQYFIMDDNPMFVALPVEFGQLRKLQELRLASSGYSGSIPPTFSQLTNLSTLSLQNNRLTGNIPIGFGNLSHIYHLNLSRNLLAGVVPFSLSFLKRLGRNLDLSGNAGMCLNPSEEYDTRFGIQVCRSKTGPSIIKPLKKSEAPRGFTRPFSLFSAWGILVLHHIFL